MKPETGLTKVMSISFLIQIFQTSASVVFNIHKYQIFTKRVIRSRDFWSIVAAVEVTSCNYLEKADIADTWLAFVK
jgi:hypothetical protein